EEVETAARTWLHEINDINSRAAHAATTLAKAHESAPEFAVRLERTAVAADAARIAAEAAEATCLAARQAVAYCEEQAGLGTLGIAPAMPGRGGADAGTPSPAREATEHPPGSCGCFPAIGQRCRHSSLRWAAPRPRTAGPGRWR